MDTLCPVCVEVHEQRPEIALPPHPRARALYGEPEVEAGIWPMTEEQRLQRIHEEFNVTEPEV